jgi:hypothetical protein
VECLKRQDRQVLGFEDFTDTDIAILEAALAPDASEAFDRKLKSQARANQRGGKICFMFRYSAPLPKGRPAKSGKDKRQLDLL